MTPESAKRIRMAAMLAVVALATGLFLFMRGYGCSYKHYAVAGEAVEFDYPSNYSVEAQGNQHPETGDVRGAWTASGGGAITGFTVVWRRGSFQNRSAAELTTGLDQMAKTMAEMVHGEVAEHTTVTRPNGARERYRITGVFDGKVRYFVVENVIRGDDLFTLIIEGEGDDIATDERGETFFLSFKAIELPQAKGAP